MNMDLSMNVADFPTVTNMDIVSYLVLTTSYYTNQQMKAYKSLNAFKYFESGFVTGCGVLKLVEKTVVLGKVKHSQKMNLAPLKVWLVSNEDGSVETAHCTCMAGLGEVCSHVGAVLYVVEHIVSSRDNTSCTDVRALWKVPSISKVDYVPLNDMKFGRIIPSPKSIVPALTPHEIVNTIENINSAKSSSVLMRIVEPFATYLAKEMGNRITVENPYTVVYREEYESYNLKELIDLASQINIKITNEECDLIRDNTLDQASSELWFRQRAGRITASYFKRAVRTSAKKSSLSLIKSICDPVNFQFKSKATEWGKNNEKTALAAYIQEQNGCHENLEVRSVGLCLVPQYPFFGASPDALVSCSCCSEGCVEIKCPYLLKDKTIQEYCTFKSTCLKSCEEGLYLDKDHSYYYQLQKKDGFMWQKIL